MGEDTGNFFTRMFGQKTNDEGQSISPIDMGLRTLAKTMSSSNDREEQAWGRTLDSYWNSKDYTDQFNFKKKLDNNYKASLLEINKIIDDPNLDYNSKVQSFNQLRSKNLQDAYNSGSPTDLALKHDKAFGIIFEDKMQTATQEEKIKQKIRQDIAGNVLLSGGSAEDLGKTVNTLMTMYKTNPDQYALAIAGNKSGVEEAKISQREKKAEEKSFAAASKSLYSKLQSELPYGTLNTLNGGNIDDTANRDKFLKIKAMAGDKWEDADMKTIGRQDYHRMLADAAKNSQKEKDYAFNEPDESNAKIDEDNSLENTPVTSLKAQQPSARDKLAYDAAMANPNNQKSAGVIDYLRKKYGIQS